MWDWHVPVTRWNPRSDNVSLVQTCCCLILQIKLYLTSKHVLNTNCRQIINIARTLSVTLAFFEMSKDNIAIKPTCTCKRLFTSRMTLWTELLHNYWAVSFIHDCFWIRRCEMVSENKSNIDSWYVSLYLAHHDFKNCRAVVQKEVQLCKKRRYVPIGPPCISFSRPFSTAQTVSSYKSRRSAVTCGFVLLGTECQ